MTKLTREQVEGWLAGATDAHLETIKRCMTRLMASGSRDDLLLAHDIHKITDALRERGHLARELLAAWDREAKLREALEYIASASDLEGYEPGMWAINRARHTLGDTP